MWGDADFNIQFGDYKSLENYITFTYYNICYGKEHTTVIKRDKKVHSN